MKSEQKNHHLRVERIILGVAATFAGLMAYLAFIQFAG